MRKTKTVQNKKRNNCIGSLSKKVSCLFLLDNTSGYRYTIDNKDERGTEPMIIDDLLRDAKMSQYKLSKESGVAQATISDICSRKTTMKKCAAGTLYRIAKTLNVTVDLLLEADEQAKENDKNQEYRSSFETFKSNTCHHVKDMGDIDFIIDTLEKNTIRNLYEKAWYPESLYLLGMVDYLSKINDLPICTNYNDIRKHKLATILYPSSVLIQAAVMHSDEVKIEAIKNAIPEFMRFNIVESEVRNLA